MLRVTPRDLAPLRLAGPSSLYLSALCRPRGLVQGAGDNGLGDKEGFPSIPSVPDEPCRGSQLEQCGWLVEVGARILSAVLA